MTIHTTWQAVQGQIAYEQRLKLSSLRAVYILAYVMIKYHGLCQWAAHLEQQVDLLNGEVMALKSCQDERDRLQKENERLNKELEKFRRQRKKRLKQDEFEVE